LVFCALALMQGVRDLIEPRLRCIAVLCQLAHAVVGLLRQHHIRLRAFQCGLARGDGLGSRAGPDIGNLRLGHDLGRQRLLMLGDRLRGCRS
jgi:hypothetical protein